MLQFDTPDIINLSALCQIAADYYEGANDYDKQYYYDNIMVNLMK